MSRSDNTRPALLHGIGENEIVDKEFEINFCDFLELCRKEMQWRRARSSSQSLGKDPPHPSFLTHQHCSPSYTNSCILKSPVGTGEEVILRHCGKEGCLVTLRENMVIPDPCALQISCLAAERG